MQYYMAKKAVSLRKKLKFYDIKTIAFCGINHIMRVQKEAFKSLGWPDPYSGG